MIEIIVKDVPQSNNRFIGRNQKWKFQEVKKEWEQKLTFAGIGKVPERPIDRAIVHIHYTFPDRRRRDPDNYSGKMLLDPLVRCGFIEDDSFFHILLLLTAECRPKVKETRITIYDIGEGEFEYQEFIQRLSEKQTVYFTLRP